MSEEFYSTIIGSVKRDLNTKRVLENKRKNLIKSLQDSQSLYVRMINAQKLLSTVSDENTQQTLDFITGMVNKVLSDNIRRIQLKKKLFGGSKPHINVEIVNGDGNVLDIEAQEGAGLGQIISFMYVICLIEIRKGRRLLILDERLNGLHKQAKQVLSEIIKIFAEGGFQFIFIEYSLNDLGKIYNVENRSGVSNVVSLDGVQYSDDMVYSEDLNVDLSILDEDYKEDEDLEEEVVIG